MDTLDWARVGIARDDGGIYGLGWISGKPEHRRRLRKIGVRGRMDYNDDGGYFAHCVVSDEVMQRLLVAGWIDYPGAFTRVNLRTGEYVEGQTWWHWPSLNQLKYEGYVAGQARINNIRMLRDYKEGHYAI